MDAVCRVRAGMCAVHNDLTAMKPASGNVVEPKDKGLIIYFFSENIKKVYFESP